MTNTFIQKEYYSLIELRLHKLTPLRQKALSTRFGNLLKSGKLVYGQNLFRAGSSWQIHKSAIPLFQYKAIMKVKN